MKKDIEVIMDLDIAYSKLDDIIDDNSNENYYYIKGYIDALENVLGIK